MSDKGWRWAAGLVLLGAMLVRGLSLDLRFRANDESTACAPLLCTARNFLRYGPAASRFAGIINTGQVAPEHWFVYAHHPPLVPLLIAGAQHVAGEDEWTARLPSALFSVGATALLMAMVRRRFGWRPAAIAGAIYAFCPMTLALGGMPDYVGPQLVFLGLATIECYLRFAQGGEGRWLIAACATFLLGALTDWPIFYLVPILCGHYVLTGGRAAVWRAAPFALGAAAVLTALALWAQWAGGDVSILHQFRQRAIGNVDHTGAAVTPGAWIRHIVLLNGRLHTWPVLGAALACFVVVWVACKREGRQVLRRHECLVLLAAWALLHLLIGRQSMYQHPWWHVVLTPALALAAAMAVHWSIDRAMPNSGGLRWASAAGIALVGLGWLAVSAATARAYIQDEYNGAQNFGYTLKSLATTIRQVAAPDEGVLTSAFSDRKQLINEPPLWYYADRQLRPAIVTVEKLNASLGAGPYELCYRYVQPGGPRPRWFVMPQAHRRVLGELAAYLDARFRSRRLNDCVVYALD